jgi:hypothetical protein
VRCPVCESGGCWFCAKTTTVSPARSVSTRQNRRLSGSWSDGSKLVEDSLSENSHKMGSFLTSKIDGVRLSANPRSVEAHDILEFRRLVRECHPEERR